MRIMAVILLSVACYGQTRVDGVLARMAPPGTVTIVGARMDQLKATPLYTKMVAEKKLPELDRFARETGFDPRSDVRELLVATNGKVDGSVLLARGAFHVTNFGTTKQFKHGQYVIHGDERAGFCFLDATLAAAGPLPQLYAALDQWKSGAPPAISVLLKRAEAIPAHYQLFAVSEGGLSFLMGMLQARQGGPDFGQILRSLERTSFQADLSGGLEAVAQGDTATDEDAKNLGDAARGIVGFARLSVPDDHRELLKLWDGIKVDQTSRHIAITIKVSEELIDQLLNMLQGGQFGPMKAHQ